MMKFIQHMGMVPAVLSLLWLACDVADVADAAEATRYAPFEAQPFREFKPYDPIQLAPFDSMGPHLYKRYNDFKPLQTPSVSLPRYNEPPFHTFSAMEPPQTKLRKYKEQPAEPYRALDPIIQSKYPPSPQPLFQPFTYFGIDYDWKNPKQHDKQ